MRLPDTPLTWWAFSALWAGILAYALITGKLPLRGMAPWLRSEQPGKYWFGMGLFGAVLLAIIGVAVFKTWTRLAG